MLSMPYSCSVIIPTLNAQQFLPRLIDALRRQHVAVVEIVVIDSDSTDTTAMLASQLGCIVASVARSEFNHGGTRNKAVKMTTGDLLIFLTQDALPADPFFVTHLIAPIISGVAVASYARQIAYPGASKRETFFRSFNYPAQNEFRTQKSLLDNGVKDLMFSNVASAIRRDVFFEVGMFDEQVVMNEDMLLCARLLQGGHVICYAADALVYHSHTYSLRQIFSRYFDIGVFFVHHMTDFVYLKVSARGETYVFELFKYLLKINAWNELFMFICETSVKFIGFYLGNYEACLPISWKRAFSMHKNYWKS